jgi:hypothetical protein
VICRAIPEKLAHCYDHSAVIESVTLSGCFDRYQRFSEGRHQDGADIVDQDIYGPHIDGLIKFVQVKVLWRPVGRSPIRYLVDSCA